MDIFDQARNKASYYLLKELNLEGYKELRHPTGSLFHKVNQNGLADKAIIITVHVEPNIGSEYKFRRTDSLEFQDLLERSYEIWCYHYYFDETLQEPTVEKNQVTSTYDILEFWDNHGISYKADKPDSES